MKSSQPSHFRSYPTESLLGPLNETEQRYAPKSLFVAGDVGLLNQGPRVSIIGSRKASPAALKNAEQLSRFFVEHGCVIVSGLAEGIDTTAHETAISCGGKTIAVLGTPLDKFYPPQNRQLQDKIMRDHLAISQFPIGSAIQKHNFPLRNRTMALISDASVIVEAGETSGTQHQGWEALRLNRPLYILKPLAENPNLKWPQEMLKYGAFVLSKPYDVLDLLPAPGRRLDIYAPL